MKFSIRAKLCGVIILGCSVVSAAPISCPAVGSVTLNFDSVPVAVGTAVDATSYLNANCISFNGLTPGVRPVIVNDGGAAAIATSPPNWFNVDVPGLGPGAVSYELDFAVPVSDVSFSRTAIATQSGIPPFTVTALNAQGQAVATFSESFLIGPSSRLIALPGSDITALRFDGANDTVRTTFNTPPLDDLSFTVGSVPEPSTIYLLSIGLCGIAMIRHCVCAHGSTPDRVPHA